MKTIVITSWYFNPIHPGHIECFELCKELWDELWVIVNNDNQVKAKTEKDVVFQDEQFRLKIVSSLKLIDYAFMSIDQDWSVCQSIKYATEQIRNTYWVDAKIIFGKWWDRFSSNIPEVQICNECNIEIRDWLWAKTHNSSDYRKK